MKQLFRYFLFVSFIAIQFVTVEWLYGQAPVLPVNPNRSVLFGKDIVIHDMPDRDQRNIAVCSAFNGWLYATYSYSYENNLYNTILKSTDGGITWNILMDSYGGNWHDVVLKSDIIVCGNNLDDLEIFLAVLQVDTFNLPEFGSLFVLSYHDEPFASDSILLQERTGWYKDVSLACDQNYPANGAYPYSIGILFSKQGQQDSLIFCSSSNGGLTFDNRKTIIHTSKKIEKVSLTYGRSASQNTGRYFAAWEEKETPNATLGRIYTNHNVSDINSAFTQPVCIDNINPSLINQVRNPVLACQASAYDNDSSNLTEVLLFEKYVQATNSYDIQGFYNLQATVTSHFRELSIASNANNEIEPDIAFNPYDSNFMVTYFDSTEKNLPFLSHKLNMIDPDNWGTVTGGYNDTPDLATPHPRVELNLGEHTGMNVWINGTMGSNGIAKFDSPYSTWTGLSSNHSSDGVSLYGAYPNPCFTNVSIWFYMRKPGKVCIALFDSEGRSVGKKIETWFQKGKNCMPIDISKLSNGNYVYTFTSEDLATAGKIIIAK
jgi:hypothetical protein